MIILGIDPGSRSMGFGAVKAQGQQFRYVASGAWRFDQEKVFLHRLPLLYRAGRELMARYSPHHVAVESLIYAKNASSLAKLAQARGAVLSAFGEDYRNRIFEYPPNQVKSYVSGFGHSAKAALAQTLHLLLDLPPKDQWSHDETDALAVALAHGIGGQASGHLARVCGP